MALRVNEIFKSIQGEGVNAGLPTVFVRLQGCNLSPNCYWCDTSYAQEEGGETLSVDEVMTRVTKLFPEVKGRICITGGEPLSQNLDELMTRLAYSYYYVEIFTNGTLPKPRWWTRVDSWIVDHKLPSTGVTKPFCSDWLTLRESDQYKLTVNNRDDYPEVLKRISTMAFSPCTILVSPVVGLSIGENDRLWLQEIASLCIERNVRFSLQVQKIVWGNRRGV